MEYRILGPFEVTHEGRLLTMSRRERLLLALLLVLANQAVSAERLVEELWEERPPDQPIQSLRVQVSRLRRQLRESGADGVLVTLPRGYSLTVDRDAVDAHRFEALLARGRQQAASGDHPGAAATLAQALSLWRGPALGGVDAPSALRIEAARLEEARLAALEERIDADLASGRHSELAAELDALTRAHPLRERLWSQRMLALYRAGRQAEALRAFRQLRRLLGEELGIEPSTDLARLETAILRHDPALDWQASAGPVSHEPASRSPRDGTAGSRPLTEERRWATVVFADLSGFTGLAEQTDPEDMRALLSGCMSAMAEIVEQFGGVPMRVIGDQLMALFGAPVAHGDDPERAVRAALEIQRCARQRSEEFGGLPLRIGVNSGDMMFGPVGPDQAFTVIGDAVNVATRLRSGAPLGGVLAGEETFRATRRRIRYQPVTLQPVKGKAEPVAAYLALAVTAAGEETPGTPLVGRDLEIGVVSTLWQRVVTDRTPHLITIVGAPGIGKTRLAQEFRAVVQRAGGRSWVGRSLPYGERTGYGAFAQQVKAVAGIFDTDSVPVARGKLRRRVSGLLPLAWVEDVGSHLSLIAGLETATAGPDKGALLLSARRFVEALAREQPTVLVFEDLHWAGPTLIDLVESVAGRARDAPVLLLALARPQLFDVRPGWSGGLTSSTLLELPELAAADADRLLGSLLPGTPDPALVGAVVERAGGNPLFLEELAASVVERPGQPADALPANIKSIIAARLDSLPPAERQLLLDASVVGKLFWAGALRALGSADPAPLLDRLEARDLVRLQPTSRIEGDDEFAFKHILIREAAYATLPKAARRQRHGAVARFLEEAMADRAVESSSLLAHHWREAGDSQRTVDYLLVAAERARQAWAKGEAMSLYDEALELIPESQSELRRTVRLQRALLLVQSGIYHAGAEELDALIPELDAREEVEALVARGYCCAFLEDARVMTTVGARALAVADTLGDEDLKGPAMTTLASGKLFAGEVAESLAITEQALALWRRGSYPSQLALVLGMAGNQSYLLGRYGEAIDYGRRGHQLGREIHHADPTLWAGAQVVLGMAGLGRHEEALGMAEDLVALGQQLGTVPVYTAIVMNVWAGVLREIQDLDASRRLNMTAIELAGSVPFVLPMIEGKVDLLVADLSDGEFGRAERAWDKLWAEAGAMPGVHQWRNLGRLEAARAEISLAAGRLERAADEAVRALEGARRVGRVKYEIANRVILGRALLGLGRHEDALPHLRLAAAAADTLKHPPSGWSAGSALARALYATGEDEAAGATAAAVVQSVSRFAQTLPEKHRNVFLASERIEDLLALCQ